MRSSLFILLAVSTVCGQECVSQSRSKRRGQIAETLNAINTADECCEACGGNDDCVVWNFDTSGSGECELLRNVNDPSRSRGWETGLAPSDDIASAGDSDSDAGPSDSGDGLGPIECSSSPTCDGVDCTIFELNSMIFRIRLDSARSSRIFAEWELCDGPTTEFPKLRGPALERDTAYIMRLKENALYQYQIFEEGSSDPIAQGSFRAGEPPREIRDFSVEWIRGTVGESTRRFVLTPRNRPPYWVIFDRYGNQVWWLEKDGMPTNGSFRRRQDGNIYFMQDFIGGFLEFTPWGEEVKDYTTRCQILHHFLDDSNDGDIVWSIGKSRYRYGGLDDDQAIDNVVAIERDTGDWTIEIDLHDYFDPVRHRSTSSDRESTASELFGCDDSDDDVNDWAHVNGIDVTDEGDFVLLTARNLDVIWAFDKNTTSRSWDLAYQFGGEESDFDFPDNSDRFYGAHGAVSNGRDRILLFDNGKSRPRDDGGFFSRAIEYELDFGRMQARAIWQTSMDMTERPGSEKCGSGHRGNLFRLRNGNTYSIYTDCPGHPDGNVGFIAEHDSNEDLVALAQIDLDGETFLYGFEVFDSIFGEEEL